MSGDNTGAPLNIDLMEPSQAQADVKFNAFANKVNDYLASHTGGDSSDTASDTSESTGAFLPPGGTTGQVLTKITDADGDADWRDSTGGSSSDTGSDAGGVSGLIEYAPDIEEDGSSLSNFTALGPLSAAWTSDGTKLTFSSSTASDTILYHNTVLEESARSLPQIIEAKIKPTNNINTGDQVAGLVFYNDGANISNNMAVGFYMNSLGGQNIAIIHVGVAVLTHLTFAWTVNIEYRLRLVVNGSIVFIYIDGTLIGSYNFGGSQPAGDYSHVGLYGIRVEAQFRDFKHWSSVVQSPSAGTVAALPVAPYTGQRSFVSDATSTTFLSTVAGGGSHAVPVVYDGTNWVIG